MPDVEHVILLLHGIRTHGEWIDQFQTTLSDALQRRKAGDSSIVVRPFRYGYFSALKFILPGLFRTLVVRKFLRAYERVRQEYPETPISVVAHSFGVYVFCRALSEYTALRFKYAILLGSVVSQYFDWAAYLPQRVEKVVNECALKDVWPVLARLLVYGMDSSGVFGFVGSGLLDPARFVNRKFSRARHSQFFYASHFEEFWLPLVLDAQIRASPEQHARPPLWLRILNGCRWIIRLSGAVALVALIAAQAPAVFDPGQKYLLQGEGSLSRDNYEIATQKFLLAVGRFESRGRVVDRVRAFLGLGSASYMRGQYGSAAGYWKQGLSLVDEIQIHDRELKLVRGELLRRLGKLALHIGSPDEADSYYNEAYAIFAAESDNEGLLRTLTSQAEVHRALDDYGQTRRRFEDALKIAPNVTDIWWRAEVVRAAAEFKLGDQEWILSRPSREQAMREIKSQFGEAMGMFRAVGSRRGEASVFVGLGNVDETEGDLDSAIRKYDKAGKIFTEIHFPLGEAAYHAHLAQAIAHKGDLRESERNYERAKSLFEQLGVQLGLAHSLFGLGRINAEMGTFDSAERHLRQAMVLYEKQNHLIGRARTHLAIARMSRKFMQKEYWDRWYSDRATGHYQHAKQLYKDLGKEAERRKVEDEFEEWQKELRERTSQAKGQKGPS